MSTADQEQVRAQVPEAEAGGPDPDAVPAAGRSVDPLSPEGAAGETAAYEPAESEPVLEGHRLTPRQARRLRVALSSVGMVVMAVVLWMRIASRSSVLVVGVYGLALILCGIVMELSRNGRTRLASWLLGIGLLAAVGTDWLLLP